VVDHDPPIAEEEQTLSLVRRLRADGDTAPIIASLRDGDRGPERVRDALTVLAELDLDLIVQVALDSLIEAHLNDPPALDKRAGSHEIPNPSAA
jgi:hypothetical protein